MSTSNNGPRRKAAAAATLLFLAGGLSGVLVDRLLIRPRAVEATPLTARAMAARLDLSRSDEARIRALLDSLHAEVAAAAQQGPDSLRTVARSAHQRLEAALPPEARAEFRIWMQEHHRRMMERMGGAPMHGPGSMGPGGPGMHHDDR